MKLKSLATTILAGGLLAAAGPSVAGPCSALTTIALWQGAGAAGCTDVDGDSTWIFGASTLPANTAFTLTENQGVGFDVYNAAFGFPGGLTTAGGSISYTAIGNATEMFDAADYDTTVTEPTGVAGAMSTATVVNVGGTPFSLTQTSIDGSHVPITGETPFAQNLTIGVTDTITAVPAGITFNDINNSLQVGSPTIRVPEPATLLLIGAALAGAGFTRRRKQS